MKTNTEKTKRTLSRGETLDVALVLEGTYPYVSGGVSSWVHQIIRGLAEIRFGIFFIGGDPSHYQGMKYDMPPNVVHLEEHYLSSIAVHDHSGERRGDPTFFDIAAQVHDALKTSKESFPSNLLRNLATPLAERPGSILKDFLHSELSWDEITSRYRANCSELSFVDYFWTVRSVHAPLFMLALAAKNAPKARAYHTVSTGFAGFFGTILSQASGRPLILTEHGIYTKERRIELLQADWLKEASSDSGEISHSEIGYIRQLWIRFFEGIGRITYSVADPIIALYEGNRQRQVADGATAERTGVIPNGIELERFAPLRANRPAKIPRVVGLLGRIVPIKDVKTFVRMVRILANEIDDIEGWLIGPEDEDKAYASECHSLVKNLGVERHIKFLGFQRPEAVLPKLGLMVLTSISEAQPLSLLEGFSAGVPCVSSDVGCCRELVYGATPEDQALGAAGRIVPIANPEATATAIKELLLDESAWRAAQRAGIERVERYYTLEKMIGNYRNVYTEAMGR
ncbi:MAG: GT4 family glycosyltransferase PelF [Polyangiaceae bacterium]|nr:GT4 family glycosyltransferase PelF [Polyangiaceae bacterium]